MIGERRDSGEAVSSKVEHERETLKQSGGHIFKDRPRWRRKTVGESLGRLRAPGGKEAIKEAESSMRERFVKQIALNTRGVEVRAEERS